jgi:hypothetical protein
VKLVAAMISRQDRLEIESTHIQTHVAGNRPNVDVLQRGSEILIIKP